MQGLHPVSDRGSLSDCEAIEKPIEFGATIEDATRRNLAVDLPMDGDKNEMRWLFCAALWFELPFAPASKRTQSIWRRGPPSKQRPTIDVDNSP